MTAAPWPSVSRCACGRLDIEHDLLPATTRLPERRVGTDNGQCAGFEPASVLRACLEAVAAIPARPVVPGDMDAVEGMAYAQGWMDARAAAVRAARGETP
ncbi:hypothetical protein BBK14_11390 [Parafrankia soli]|uniref:Uncharacterized protein n=1 Tax=Parafrankia soli TaxID=2599596 RepID=A0A1S1R8D7_9ACTN|nr:hypothetical protein [Parafrankia soli]OHV42217.1 hypothetical protein BBK14_11390 [Parafrankia soli]